MRFLAALSLLAPALALAATVSTSANAQQPAQHDHRMFSCLPNGLSHGGRAGEGSIAPAGGTPMQLTNDGVRPRRALFIVLHDSSQAWSAPSDWRTSGRCDG